MSNTTETPLTQWHMLRLNKSISSVLEIPTLESQTNTSFGPIRYALSKQSGARLLIPVGRGQRLAGLEDTGALNIRFTSLIKDKDATFYIDITCTNSNLETVFSEVTSELLHRINNGESAADATASTLNDFKLLLTSATPDSIPTSKIAGLIAELLILDDLLTKNPSSWKAWRGPLLERHDFRAGGLAIEVKCTTRAAKSKISIPSIDQLQEPNNGELYLTHIILEEVHNGGISIQSLTSNILDKTSNTLETMKLLSAIGCEDAKAQKWNIHKFHLEKISTYRVDKQFPKLTIDVFQNRSSLKGISNIAYDVDLNIAQSSLLNKDEEKQLFERIAKCIQ